MLSSAEIELGPGISWAEAGDSGFWADFPFPEDREPPLMSPIIYFVPAQMLKTFYLSTLTE